MHIFASSLALTADTFTSDVLWTTEDTVMAGKQ